VFGEAQIGVPGQDLATLAPSCSQNPPSRSPIQYGIKVCADAAVASKRTQHARVIAEYAPPQVSDQFGGLAFIEPPMFAGAADCVSEGLLVLEDEFLQIGSLGPHRRPDSFQRGF
jgi:hypothetical protein